MNPETTHRIDSISAEQMYPGEIIVLTAEAILYHGLDLKTARAVVREQERKERWSTRLVNPFAPPIPKGLPYVVVR